MRNLKKILFLITTTFLVGCTPVNNEKELLIKDEHANSYVVGDRFDSFIGNGGLDVSVKMADGSVKNLTKKEFTYKIATSSGRIVVGTEPFEDAGNYTVTVSRDQLTSVKETIKVLSPSDFNLDSISLNPSSCTVKQNSTFNFMDEVVVTAHYTNGVADKNVTNKALIGNISTDVVGTKQYTISYSENGVIKSATFTLFVEPENTITVEEAVAIIDKLPLNTVSDKEYYVRGITNNVEKDSNGFNGGFLNSNLEFRSIKENGVANTVDDLDGKEAIIFGYLENYKDIYQIPYLPANASPTGQKYNGKLIWVDSSSSGETVDVTKVSISPVNKTISLNESDTLSATVLPENANDKTLTWSSSNPSICSVTNYGVIKGLAVGNAVITAKSINNISATCNVTVESGSVTPIEGNVFEIAFNKFGNDGQTELNFSTITEQITAGANNISGFNVISKVYKGINGLKFGSSRSGGEIDFNLSSTIKSLKCSEIIVDVAQYGTKSTTVSIYGDDEVIKSGSSGDSKITAKLSEAKQLSSIAITTSSRAYISKISIVCEEIEEIPVTGITIPSSLAVATGNSESLSVSYTPSNANRGKGITWTSQNTAIAIVSGGVVTGVKAGSTTITAKSEGGFTSICNVTVSNIAVQGVSVSPTSQTLSIGGTKQLTATVSPSNASNKNVTWSSNNSTVASVNSTGLVTAKAAGNATITAKTVDGNKSATCAITVTEVKKDAWTIMIYMCGADLESESGLATGDIMEIFEAGTKPDDVNIVIQTGGAKDWALSKSYISGATKIDENKVQRWHIGNNKLVFDEDVFTYNYRDTKCMGTSDTLQDFVEYGIEEYPAEKTGFIFWNHGGAMYGCCYDENKSDDSLSNSEMKQAFSAALSNTGSDKLEFVGYDTCLTQVQDIAEFNSKYFNYMIASEESEEGYGWDYDTWIDDVYDKHSTSTILTAIVDGFITDNGGINTTRSNQTLSWLDLSAMPAYKTAFENFASALKTKLTNDSISKSTFASWMSNKVKVFCKDSDQDEKYYCLFDVKDMLNKLAQDSSYNPGSSYLSALQSAFSNLVKYSVAQKGAGNAYGLGCIYCQSSTYSSYLKRAYTSSETNFTNWFNFLKSYSYLG